MKYFILRGLLPEPISGAPHFGGNTVPTKRKDKIARWQLMGPPIPLPKEGDHCFLSIKGVGRISVFVHDVYDALLIISANSQEKAYELASPFRAFATVFLGCPPDDNAFEYLIELKSKPEPSQTIRKIAQLYNQIWQTPINLDVLVSDLRSGSVIKQDRIRYGCNFVKNLISSQRLVLCLLHLERSHYLFSGFMSSSYYHYHYRYDRKAESKYVRRKKYLEDKTKYDLAFLSAFRAIEALLGTLNLKKKEIGEKVNELDRKFKTSLANTPWTSYHEVFTTRRKKWNLSDLISLYLDTRNAVAAHANPKPPFNLHEDQVYEIQRLVEHMLYQAAGQPNYE